MILFITCAALLLLSLSPRSFAQSTFSLSGEITPVTRILPGALRSDGLTTPARLLRYHLTPSDYLPGGVIIKTRSYLPRTKEGGVVLDGEIGAILRPLGITSTRIPFPQYGVPMAASADRHGLGRIFEVRFSVPENVPELCARLERLAAVEYAEPMIVRRTTAMPDDPRVTEQYGLQRVEAEAAWDISTGDTSVVIAIVDGGVDWKHEDLAANIWTNPNEIPQNGVDDDGNGKVDDVHGWDFVGSVSQIQVLGGLFLEDNDPGYVPGVTADGAVDHGTHCAGVAGAVTNNAIGMAGLAYNVRLMPVKAGSDQNGEGVDGRIYRGYEGVLYAASMGADIISCSWGGGVPSLAEIDAISQATDLGALVIAAAGNEALNADDYLFYPGSFPNVLAVGASDRQDAAASFSNYGIGTGVFAPGVKILSTIARDNRYSDSYSGTSMATPLVAGLAALVKSVHPDWSAGEIAYQLRSTVDNVVAADSLLRPRYFGRINARRALEVNRSESEGERLPGIGIISVGVDAAGGVITDEEEKFISLTLRNYLAPVADLTVRVTPLGEEVEVIAGEVTIDSIGHMQSAEVDLSIRVVRNATWYEGAAQMLISYDAAGYHNVELLQIPYTFDSDSRYTLLASGLPGRTEVSGGHSPSPSVLWGVGEVPGLGGGFIRVSGANYNYNIISAERVTSVFAFDDRRALATSGPFIMQTTDGGTGWTNSSLASITASAQSVHFFDATEGVVIGEPLNGSWGIATSGDGGMSWEPPGVPLPAGQGEMGVRGSAAWLEDHGWFAATGGLLYHTEDRGETWERFETGLGSDLEQITFLTTQNGLGIVTTGEAPHIVRTTDGGMTWSPDGPDLSEYGVVPVYLSAIPEHGAYVVMGSDGRVMMTRDDGMTWEGIATSRTNAYISGGTGYSDDERARIWSLGTSVGVLDVSFPGSSAPDASGEASSPLQITSIYPNPLTSGDEVTLTLALDASAPVNVEVIDMTGRVVLRQDVGRVSAGTVSLVLRLGDLPSGPYICRVQAGERVRSRRVTVGG